MDPSFFPRRDFRDLKREKERRANRIENSFILGDREGRQSSRDPPEYKCIIKSTHPSDGIVPIPGIVLRGHPFLALGELNRLENCFGIRRHDQRVLVVFWWSLNFFVGGAFIFGNIAFRFFNDEVVPSMQHPFCLIHISCTIVYTLDRVSFP